MRLPYAHEAHVELRDGGDPRALGGAVTIALCGGLEHAPPCPLAPHHSAPLQVDGNGWRLRVVFAATSDTEPEVRARIDDALSAGRLTGPDGVATSWTVVSSSPSELAPDEAVLGQRLVEG